MEVNEMLTILGAGVGLFGGFEGIKWIVHYFTNRKTLARKEEADTDLHEADAKVRELEAEKNQWELFKDMISELQKALLKKDEVIARKDDVIKEKDKLYGEQTARLRTIQDELLALHKEHTNLKARFVYVDTWKCQIGTCTKREPPKPQLYGLEYNEEEMPIEHPNEEFA